MIAFEIVTSYTDAVFSRNASLKANLTYQHILCLISKPVLVQGNCDSDPHIAVLLPGGLHLLSPAQLYADWPIGVRPGAVHTLQIQYRTAESNVEWQNSKLPLGHQPCSKVILNFCEMYLLFLLSMKEQVINSLRPVGKCNPACYPPSVIQIPLGSAS